ncbi:nuclear transport factor 2 family protein [Bailinhaonella thermotolerans]|uniref:Nuclear transport factor 2 family protein n=1 Tax=Bailinhaonella thermotolerans TaxID=1070861 RepID=A0A3A4AAX6_9ACTN|nr:nuclear transport factor 2 family protein [Bailinhaonella thermotolerans]RJL22588.1 nuclear transport factor 2 family protein [Bailinhaonella thermotolerans]
MDRQIQELLDKTEIRELVNAYASAADRHDQERMRALYHEDAIDEHGPFSQGSAMEFVDRLPEIQAPMEILQHHITTVNLKLSGDRAEGEVYVLALHKVTGSGDMLVGGRYLDKYAKRDGVWKFLHRALVADWFYAVEPSEVNLGHPFVTGAHLGRPGADDPSYGFFTLFRRGER